MLLNITQSRPLLSITRMLLSRQLASATQASDPIQKLFVDKIREYANKSKSSSGDGLVDATEKSQKEFKEEKERIARTYGVEDESQIANLNFKWDENVKLDPIDMK